MEPASKTTPMSIVTHATLDLETLILEAEQLVERRKKEALSLADKAMAIALQTRDSRHQAYAHYIQAFYHCLVENDYTRAISISHKALQSLREEDAPDIGYKIYMVLGNAYQMRGDTFDAHNTYLRGLKLLEGLDSMDTRQKSFAGSFYYNLAAMLVSEQNKEAEAYLAKAISLYSEVQNRFKLSKSYIAYAGVLEARQEYAAAIEYLFKALQIDEELNDPYSIALTKANLCELHLRIGAYDQALTYLDDALSYYDQNQMLYETAKTRQILGKTLFAVGRRDQGISELLRAEELFEQLDNKRELSELYDLLGNCYGEMQEYALAWLFQKKHSSGLKDFYNVERERALTIARKEFETERKEKEAALLQQKHEEIQLYVRKLEISNNELKQFAQVASHDLREPLRAITSYMDLLRRSLAGTVTAEQADFITFAINAGKRMDRLITDVLRLAKVDSNAHLTEINLQSIFTEIALNLEQVIKDRNALIMLPESWPRIAGDRTQILQLFQNLVANGIKYNTSTQPVIQVSATTKDNFAEISVADNGIGIPDQYRQKVFDIFQRLDRTQESGSGIGLTIVKKIVDNMGGKIWIEDNQPAGCVFMIRLPIHRAS